MSGATSGIGREVAGELAKKGFDLVVIGRSEEKGEALKAELRSEAPDSTCAYFVADMTDLAQVKSVAGRIAEDFPVIDVLINNAGGVYASYAETAEGIEKTIAGNHLGYYITTLRLLPSLRRSADARIIVVASASHYRAKIDFDSFTADTGYNMMKAYGQSKLANVLFTYELAEKLKGSGIAVNCIHPGVVKTPIGYKTGSRLFSLIWKLFSGVVGISTEESAKTYVYLASDPNANEHDGVYFHAGKPRKSSGLSYDKGLQDKLWAWSAEVTGLDLTG